MLHARKWLHTKSCPIKTIYDLFVYKAHKLCLCKYPGFTYGELVYITPWVAVQFGINCMSKVCNFTRQIHWSNLGLFHVLIRLQRYCYVYPGACGTTINQSDADFNFYTTEPCKK